MRAHLAGFSLIVLLLSGCSTPPGEDFDPIASPDWRPGYHFGTETTVAISMDGIMESDGETERLDEDMPAQVVLTQQRTVLATDLGSADEPVYLVRETMTSEGFQGRTGAGIELRPATRIVGIRAADLLPVSASLTATKATFGDLEPNSHALVKFPLERGASWTTTVNGLHEVMDISEEWTITSTVQGMETVPGPDGDVSAVRVHHELDVPDLEALEAAMREDAKESGATLERFDFQVEASVLTHYAPSLHAIVRNEVVADMTLDVAAQSNGRSFEGRMHVVLRMTETLTEVQLVEGPPADLASLLEDVVDIPEIVPPPRPIASPLGLALKSDVAAPNAAEAPTVTFTATTQRPVGPDDDVTIRLFDAFGSLLDSTDGPSLAAKVDRMGLYRIVAEHRIDGGLQGRAVLELPVRYEKDEQAGCALIVVGSCSAFELPVTPDLARMSLEATGKLVGLPATELVVYDGADGEVAATSFEPGGTASLEATDFEGADFSGPWSLRMEGLLLTPEPFTVHVLLEPTGAQTESALTAPLHNWLADLAHG